MYGPPGAWEATPSREGRAPTPSRGASRDSDEAGSQGSQSKDRKSERGVEGESVQQTEDDIPPIRPTKTAGKKSRP